MARMRELLGPEAAAFLDSYRRPAQRAVRANPLKLDPAALPGLLGIDPDPVPWCPEAFFLPEAARVGSTLAHAAGLCYVQEPSALAVGEALDVRPGQRVLDLAAAPGGKATQVAARLGGDGVVVANEVQRGRVQALADNLDRWGSWRTVLAAETVAGLADRLPGAFDRVLLDAPCSGEGLFRRNPRGRRPVAPRPGAGQRRAPARPPRRRRPPGPPRRGAGLLDLHLRPRGERGPGRLVPHHPPRLGGPRPPHAPRLRPRPPRLDPRRPPRPRPHRPPLAPPPPRRRPLHRQAGSPRTSAPRAPGRPEPQPRVSGPPEGERSRTGSGGLGAVHRPGVGRCSRLGGGLRPRRWWRSRWGCGWWGSGSTAWWTRRWPRRGCGWCGRGCCWGGCGRGGSSRRMRWAWLPGRDSRGGRGSWTTARRRPGCGVGPWGTTGRAGGRWCRWNGWPLGWGRAAGGTLKNHYPKGLRTM